MSAGPQSLTADEVRLIERVLHQAIEGPYFPEWEFQTLMGIERSRVRRIQEDWPEIGDATEADLAISNAIVNLMGYPHGEDRRLAEVFGADAIAVLQELLAKWRSSNPPV